MAVYGTGECLNSFAACFNSPNRLCFILAIKEPALLFQADFAPYLCPSTIFYSDFCPSFHPPSLKVLQKTLSCLNLPTYTWRVFFIQDLQCSCSNKFVLCPSPISNSQICPLPPWQTEQGLQHLSLLQPQTFTTTNIPKTIINYNL